MAIDVFGKELMVGQTVVRAKAGRGVRRPILEICTVTRIENDKVYLNDSHVGMTKWEDCLAIVG